MHFMKRKEWVVDTVNDVVMSVGGGFDVPKQGCWVFMPHTDRSLVHIMLLPNIFDTG